MSKVRQSSEVGSTQQVAGERNGCGGMLNGCGGMLNGCGGMRNGCGGMRGASRQGATPTQRAWAAAKAVMR